MTIVAEVLRHTSPYVFALFAYIMWQGVQSLRPRTQPVWRLLGVPGILTGTGLLLLARSPSGGALHALAWIGSAAASVPLGLATGPRFLAVDRAAGQVTRAGGPVPLLRNLVVFALQYGLDVALAFNPGAGASLAVAGHAVSGASAGYFLGWGIAFWRAYGADQGGANTLNG